MSTWMTVGRKKIEAAQVTSCPVRSLPVLTSSMFDHASSNINFPVPYEYRHDTFQSRNELANGTASLYGLVSRGAPLRKGCLFLVAHRRR